MTEKIIKFWKKGLKEQPVWALLCNFLLVMVLFSVCRIFFFLVNHDYFSEVTFAHFMWLNYGGLRFDLTALLYTNLLYLVMQMLPFKFRYNDYYQSVAKWTFIVSNGLAILVNCMDTIYFRFTNRRTTTTFFSEFKNEDNLAEIIFNNAVNYWYVTLFFVVMILILWWFYRQPAPKKNFIPPLFYYGFHTILLTLSIFLAIIGIRGGIGKHVRPITLSNANKYIIKTNEATIVQNTPFTLYRTIGKKVYKDPQYFKHQEEMERVFSPIRLPAHQESFKPLNVVIIIMESFGKEYIGYFNKELNHGAYRGYTPFLDSLCSKGYTFEYSFSNGRKSIDAMPSILSSIPMMIEPFISTPYSSNRITSIASVLKEKGYYSAFFHGAPNGSMGFDAYANLAGFQDYFGKNEYRGKDADFDGIWGIWDEEFFQFFAHKMDAFQQPFVTAVFSTSSHDPFHVPEHYQNAFPKGTLPIHQSIGYSDEALRRFFKTMSQYSWYSNTLFVITADHTSQIEHPEYRTDVNLFSVPVLFYQPESDWKGLNKHLIAQQIDIMPTILGYLNYDQSYFAFGQDLTSTSIEENYAINYNNQIYQILKGDLILQFDGEQTKSVYDFKSDPFLVHNLVGKRPEQTEMEQLLKANIQQYITRMLQNRLTEE
jgi:phosphoglycerol transferase MdoB-like AlkP superfamily enzyme